MPLTEEQKQALVADYLRVPEGERQKWMSERKVSKPWLFRWVKQFGPKPKEAAPAKKSRVSPQGRANILAALKRRWAAAAAAKKAATGKPSAGQANEFRAADEQGKRAMLAEYDSLPSAQKSAWKAAHGIHSKADEAIVSYYRSAFRKKSPSTAVVPHSTNGASPSRAVLLAEYEAVPHGQKAEWLKQHGLYKTWASNVRGRVNGAPKAPAPTVHLANVLPPATPGPVVTLDDAITAMQVRIDIYNEVLDHFRRMQRGGR